MFLVLLQVANRRHAFKALTGSLSWFSVVSVEEERHGGDGLVLGMDDGRYAYDA